MPFSSHYCAFLVAQMVKNLCGMDRLQFLGCKDHLKKGMATHSSILAVEFHGQRNLAGYIVHGVAELGSTDQLTLITSCQGYALSTFLISVDINLDHITAAVFVRSSPRMALIFPFSYCTLWKECTICT